MKDLDLYIVKNREDAKNNTIEVKDRFFDNCILDTDFLFYIFAKKDDKTIGYCEIDKNASPSVKNHFHLSYIQIDEKFRGNNFGTRFLNQVCSFLMNKGFKTLDFKVFKDDKEKSFYEKLQIPLKSYLEGEVMIYNGSIKDIYDKTSAYLEKKGVGIKRPSVIGNLGSKAEECLI